MHTQILLVVLLFPLSTALVLWCLSTLPISLAWPKTIADVAQLGRELNDYTQSGPTPTAHVVGVVAITAIWKHAWSIPGSVIWVCNPSALDHYHFMLISFSSERPFRRSLLSSICDPSSYSSHYGWLSLCNLAIHTSSSVPHPLFPPRPRHDA